MQDMKVQTLSVFSVHLVDFILSHGLSTTTQVALAQKGVCVFFLGSHLEWRKARSACDTYFCKLSGELTSSS